MKCGRRVKSVNVLHSFDTTPSSFVLMKENVVEAAAEQEPTPVPNISFSGCGFLGIYHVGVASCLKEYAPQLVAQRISGASAGALVAAALISDCCLGECTTFTLSLAMKARSRALGPLSPSFELVKNLRQAFNKFLPDNAHEIANGRLHISLTRVSDRKNILVSEFSDKDDLIDALICSSFVPLYSGILPPKYRGVRCVDGALSSNIPILDKATITVSPFAGESDICPDDNSCHLHHISLSGTSIQLTSSNLYRMSVAFFPPTAETLSNMCRQGFDDALRYLQKNKLISCARHLSIQSAITSLNTVKVRISENEDDDEELAEVQMSDNAVGVDDGNVLSDSEAEAEEEFDDNDSDVMSECHACDERERFALVDSPPVSVQSALKAICSEVNSGVMSYVYKTKVYQALSLMATPYVLPFEIAYILVKKFYDWAPYLSEDMQWFVKGLYSLIRDMLASLEADGKLVSSMTERGRVLQRWGFSWEMRWGVLFESSSSATEISPSARNSVEHRKSTSRHPLTPPPPSANSPTTAAAAAAAASVNVNMGISVDYGAMSSGLSESPLRCVSEVRRKVSEHSRRKHSHSLQQSPLDVAAAASSSGTKVRRESKRRCCVAPPLLESDSACDSFEDCLQVAEQMDAVLSYYYADEKSAGAINVVEIFPLLRQPPGHQAHLPSPSATSDSSATSTVSTPR